MTFFMELVKTTMDEKNYYHWLYNFLHNSDQILDIDRKHWRLWRQFIYFSYDLIFLNFSRISKCRLIIKYWLVTLKKKTARVCLVFSFLSSSFLILLKNTWSLDCQEYWFSMPNSACNMNKIAIIWSKCPARSIYARAILWTINWGYLLVFIPI